MYKIKVNDFLFFILILSFMHAVLRIDYTSSFSLYRVFIPITLIFFIFNYKKSLLPMSIIFILIIYNFILSYFFCACFNKYIIFSLHYISIMNIFIIMIYLKDNVDFNTMYKFLYKFLLVMLAISVLEILFDFKLPNVGQYEDGSVSVFHWTQNEFSTAILGFLPFLLVLEKRFFVKYSLIIFILYMTFFINDSKIGFIGMIIAIFIYSFKSLLNINRYYKLLLPLFVIVLMMIISLTTFDDIIISFRNDNVALVDLMIEPINRIITLNPYENDTGSIAGRTNAAIYAIKNLLDSNMFGIGIGNTYVMLMMPEYKVTSAESIHNLPLQLLVENGFIVLFLYIIIFIYFIRLLLKDNLRDYEYIKLIAIPSYLIGSLSSSGGIFSNYYFIACLILIIIMDKKYNNQITRKINEIKK